MGRLAARVVVWIVAAGMVAAALAGCDGDDGAADGPTATVPTTPPDPYAVPAVIDEAYVNRVLAALDQADGDVTRLVARTGTVPPEAVDRLKALYVGDYLQLQIDILQQDILNGMKGYRSDLGNQRTSVVRLLTASPTCIFAEATRDLSEVSSSSDPRLASPWVGLVPIDPDVDPNGYNQTPWVYVYNGFTPDQSQPNNPCENSS